MSSPAPCRAALAVAALAALAVPAAASAHPGVYTVTQTVRPAGRMVFPDATCLTTATTSTRSPTTAGRWASPRTTASPARRATRPARGMINYKAHARHLARRR